MQDGLTTDPNDPRLHQPENGKQNAVYLVLSEAERAQGFVRPVRDAYVHDTCGTETRMHSSIAQTYARSPSYYGSTWCMACCKHLPVGQFKWAGTDLVVGS